MRRPGSFSVLKTFISLLCSMLIGIQCAPANEEGSALSVGFGKADITPNRPIPTIYSKRDTPDPISKISDPLSVRATYISNETDHIVLITCDLLSLDTQFTDRVKEELTALGITPGHVTINCTHTHTAPQIIYLRGVNLTDESYNDFVREQIVRAVTDAMESAEPASVGFGRAETNININRIKIGRLAKINSLEAPSGPVDNEIGILRFDLQESGKTGLLFSFACHPLTTTTDWYVISGDYPPQTCNSLEEEEDVVFAQFLQGCGGNMNPKIHGLFEVTQRFGRMLAEPVKEAYRGIKTQSVLPLKMVTLPVHLPYGDIPVMAEIDSLLAAEELKFSRQPAGSYIPRNLDWAREAKRALESGEKFITRDASIQGIEIGDIKIVTLPGEVFMEIGKAIKTQVGGDVMVLGYCNNGEVGYIPTAEQFPLGGYEVQNAPKYYNLFQWSPAIEEYLVMEAVRMMQEL